MRSTVLHFLLQWEQRGGRTLRPTSTQQKEEAVVSSVTSAAPTYSFTARHALIFGLWASRGGRRAEGGGRGRGRPTGSVVSGFSPVKVFVFRTSPRRVSGLLCICVLYFIDYFTIIITISAGQTSSTILLLLLLLLLLLCTLYYSCS